MAQPLSLALAETVGVMYRGTVKGGQLVRLSSSLSPTSYGEQHSAPFMLPFGLEYHLELPPGGVRNAAGEFRVGFGRI